MFLYSLLLDLVVLRPLSIALVSLISTKLALKTLCAATQAPPNWKLDDEQLNLLGQFYEDYA
jgi:hypothetical protein